MSGGRAAAHTRSVGRLDCFVYFNNDWQAYAPKNALRLREILG